MPEQLYRLPLANVANKLSHTALKLLQVLSTDNGGPTYWANGDWAVWPPLVKGAPGPGYPHGGGANK